MVCFQTQTRCPPAITGCSSAPPGSVPERSGAQIALDLTGRRGIKERPPHMPHPVRNILIIRLSAIGDIIMSSSLLPGLRARYPDARITWLTEPVGEEILGGNPLIDELWILPRSRWRREWREGRRRGVLREILQLRRNLKRARFDLAIDIQGLLKSGVWAWMSGARRRVSLGGRERSSWLMTDTVQDPAGMGGQLCREYRVLAEYLELPMNVFGMALAPSPESLAAAKEQLSTLPGRPVFLFPFTTRPQKHWFDERWVELADRLGRSGENALWILGGPGDLEHAKAIAAAAQVDIGIVAGPESNLREKMALVSHAAASIGVDTGLTHLSLGLGRPTVALFGSTCPYLDTTPVPGTVLYEKLDCSPCRRHPTCNGAFTCMRMLEVSRVAAATEALLAL